MRSSAWGRERDLLWKASPQGIVKAIKTKYTGWKSAHFTTLEAQGSPKALTWSSVKPRGASAYSEKILSLKTSSPPANTNTPILLTKTNEVFNCAWLLPFPPVAAWKTQLPGQCATEWRGLPRYELLLPRAPGSSPRLPPWPTISTSPQTAITPNPDILTKGAALTHSEGFFFFFFFKKIKPLTVTDWGAHEHVKTFEPEFFGTWWSERAGSDRNLTKHLGIPKKDERNKRWGNKTTVQRGVTAIPWKTWRQVKLECAHTAPQVLVPMTVITKQKPQYSGHDWCGRANMWPCESEQ